MSSTLTERLACTFEGLPFDAGIRVKELAEANAMSRAAGSKSVEQLVTAGIIRETHRSGKSVYYQLAHCDLTVALDL